MNGNDVQERKVFYLLLKMHSFAIARICHLQNTICARSEWETSKKKTHSHPICTIWYAVDVNRRQVFCTIHDVVQWTEWARLMCALWCACMKAISTRTRAEWAYASNMPRQKAAPTIRLMSQNFISNPLFDVILSIFLRWFGRCIPTSSFT